MGVDPVIDCQIGVRAASKMSGPSGSAEAFTGADGLKIAGRPIRRRPCLCGVVGARGDRHAALGEHSADRLDSELLPDLVDERGHRGSRGSSSPANNEEAASRISLARLPSLTPRSRCP